jgi:hypothetical protein
MISIQLIALMLREAAIHAEHEVRYSDATAEDRANAKLLNWLALGAEVALMRTHAVDWTTFSETGATGPTAAPVAAPPSEIPPRD